MWRKLFSQFVTPLSGQQTVSKGAWSYVGASVLLLSALLLGSCSQVPTSPPPAATAADLVISSPVPTSVPPTPTAVPPPTVTPTAVPSTPEGSEATQEPVTELSLTVQDIRVFPVPKIINGDRVTFQVQPAVPPAITVEEVTVDIYVGDQLVSSGNLDSRNLAGSAQGIFEWVWDTTGRPGIHQVRVVLDAADQIQAGDADEADNVVELPLRVGAAKERPLEERGATWITREIDCCIVHIIARTAADRDLRQLLTTIDSAVSESAARIDTYPQEKINVYFVERTFGQGGYAGSDMVIVYNDRGYTGGDIGELVKHEIVHVLDRQFAPRRTKLLAEGVAVWAAGGHYWPQDLQRRMAALLAINGYVPLAELADSFYPTQHEIGYLEAGAFVDYLVGRFGWPDVREFYSNATVASGLSESAALDRSLQRQFNVTLAELEAEWLAELRALDPTPAEITDLQTTIRYFNAARAYQQQYDPAAYFRTAWLPHPAEVQTRGNIADFLRHPDDETNLALELLLRNAYDALRLGDYDRANVIVESVERYLDPARATIDPLVSSFMEIVHTAVAFGYEPQRIAMDGDTAHVVATTASGYRLINLDLELRRGDWVLLAN